MIVFDNEGSTFDRYTVLTHSVLWQSKLWESLGLSSDPDHPQGFSQWGLALPGPHLGKTISFEKLPENVQRHVLERLKED